MTLTTEQADKTSDEIYRKREKAIERINAKYQPRIDVLCDIITEDKRAAKNKEAII